jgi:hypothetical protein
MDRVADARGAVPDRDPKARMALDMALLIGLAG